MKKVFKFVAGAIVVLVAFVAIGAGWFWQQINASIPLYDGAVVVDGLRAPVIIERDELGVVTVHAANDLDEARALGFVHAQERFFQMDLLRRSAAGELSELVGAGAFRMDAQRRPHRMRQVAERTIAGFPDETRALLIAYTEGVNEGLRQLRSPPFEYLLLREEPRPWQPEDSVLAIAAMYFDLQGNTLAYKRHQLVARQTLPPALADFLYPIRTPSDAPLLGDAVAEPVVPGPDVYDLRNLPPEWFGPGSVDEAPPPVGSNNWAVAGAHTATGRGLLANDMHLGLQVPSIWFRVSLRRAEGHVTGVTLPGLPPVVVGSNGHVAWGFTNSYGDWVELIELEIDPEDPTRYRTPDGWRSLETVTETVAIAGEEPREIIYELTIWGPVVATLPDGTPCAMRWVAHEPQGFASAFFDLRAATDVDSAIAVAHRAGMPAQNFVVADADGRIGWTIIGQVPRRRAGDGLVSNSADGSTWTGWLEPGEVPAIVDPPEGRVWSANSRVVDGEALRRIGDGGYAHGIRASQIRDRLMSVSAATPADMLAIQLDDEALFYERWREALLATLDDATVAGDARLIAVRDAVRNWDGRAGVDAVGFRLVRSWRNGIVAVLRDALTVEVRRRDPLWRLTSFRAEEWAWPLLQTEPAHLLPPSYPDWRALRLAALERVLEDAASNDAVAVRVQHPLSRAVPALSEWLDMPPRALPGDSNMPRVQGVRYGASQRMAVSPGDEHNGYFHMPGGQSGHPRSPFYGAGHEDWEQGRPTPFMPGAVRHTLELLPGVEVGARVTAMAMPSGPGAVAPNLSVTANGEVLLSWIEPDTDGHALRFSRFAGDVGWATPMTIAQGDDWFVNWADFPALVEAGDSLYAHWLRRSGAATYAYDVVLARSDDAGATWTDGQPVHDDGTQTEHGFVALLPSADGVRLVWLDGRETGAGSGHDGHGGGGFMTLRTRVYTPAGAADAGELLDASVCDCCQTAAVSTDSGTLVVYRNRTEEEIRDIWAVRHDGAGWSEPVPVHEDGWHITGCPVNGPAAVAEGNDVFVVWFTGATGMPEVRGAWSRDGGRSFGQPIRLDGGLPVGRVAAISVGPGQVAISWLEDAGDAAEIRLRMVTVDGVVGEPLTVARSSAARASGFPRLARVGNDLLLVWTEPGDPGQLRAARVSGLR